MPAIWTIGTWTHVLIDATTGELAGVAKHVETDEQATQGVAWLFAPNPDTHDTFRNLSGYEVLPIGEIDPSVRERVLWAVAARHHVLV